MKVFEVLVDGDSYQRLEQEDKSSAALHDPMYKFDGMPKADKWRPLSVYIPNPKRPRPDFFASFLGSFVLDPERMPPEIWEFTDMAGELLPHPFEGQQFELMNILDVVNCVDAEKSIWLPLPGGRKMMQRPAFHADRFGESSLFKIPELPFRPLCYEGLKSREDEFKTFVEDNHLTGLKFREIWSDEN